eukprot:jgi/Mesvir1/22346/Mv03616-RA.1
MGPSIRRSVASTVFQWTTSLPSTLSYCYEGLTTPYVVISWLSPARSLSFAGHETNKEEKHGNFFASANRQLGPVSRDRWCPSKLRGLFGMQSWHASSGCRLGHTRSFYCGAVLRASAKEPGSSHAPVSSSGNSHALESDADRLVKFQQAEKLVRHAHVSELRRQLAEDPRELLTYGQLLDLCISSGAAPTPAQAGELAQALHASATVLILGDNVYLRPTQIADKVLGVLPAVSHDQLAQMENTLRQLEDRQRALDAAARRKALRWMTGGLAGLVAQFAIMFRLTFYDLSWDVMEPISYFLGSGSVILGYIYYLWTLRPLESNAFLILWHFPCPLNLPACIHLAVTARVWQAKEYRNAGLNPDAIAELKRSIAAMKKLPLRKQLGSSVSE